MGDLILGVILQYMVYASFGCFSQVIKSLAFHKQSMHKQCSYDFRIL